MTTLRDALGSALLVTALAACSSPTERPAPALPSAVPPSATAAPSATPLAQAEVVLTGNGIDTPQALLEFGTPLAEAEPVLAAALGDPTRDTGETSSFSDYGTCPGTVLRAFEYGDGALVVLFGDVEGPGLVFYQWALRDQGSPDRVPAASALVGDVTTYEFGVGETVAALREGSSGAELQVNEGDEVFGPSFSLADQSPGFFGYLTGTGEQDTVTEVQGGEGCGE